MKYILLVLVLSVALLAQDDKPATTGSITLDTSKLSIGTTFTMVEPAPIMTWSSKDGVFAKLQWYRASQGEYAKAMQVECKYEPIVVKRGDKWVVIVVEPLTK